MSDNISEAENRDRKRHCNVFFCHSITETKLDFLYSVRNTYAFTVCVGEKYICFYSMCW